jgi:hypothetical protein
MAYQSIDEIEREFGRKIKATEDDDERRALDLERREAVADFRELQAGARELAAYRAQVIANEGFSESAADLVTGSTPEEIDASAAKVKVIVGERQEAPPAESTPPPPERSPIEAYGRAVAGGGNPPAPKENPVTTFERSFAEKFNNSEVGPVSRRGGAEPINPAEADRFVRGQLGRYMARQLKESSRSRAFRNLDLGDIDQE